MSITVKAKIIREVFKNGDYRVFGASPLKIYNDLKLNNYNNFTLQGELPYITEGKEYTLEIEEVQNSKYPATYKVLSIPSLKLESLKDLTREESLEILSDITTSERLANNILDAYPNFIELILTEGKEAIDLKQIHGVGEKYLSAYERNINEKYKYYATIQKFKLYEIDVTECKKLYSKYSTEYDMEKAFKENPYYVLIEIAERSFNKTDTMLMKLFPELKDSEIRIEALIMEILRRNEIDGNTRLNGNVLWNVCREDYNAPKEWAKVIKDISVNSNLIYYDDKSKDLSKMDTYLAECYISNFIKEKISNSNELDIDWNNYKIVDGFELTEEQLKALENACKYDFSLLLGVSGGGKTSSLKGLITMLDDNGLTYTLLAPSGTASLRMSEQTNRPASTIHRKCLRDKEIWTDFVIVDECSMVDLDTFMMLLNCIENENAKIILVGDNNQLLPVGKGCVFNDIINSNICPYTMLTKVFRYDTNGALFVATNIRQGKQFLNNSERVKVSNNSYSIGNNYKFIQTEEDDIFEELRKQYMKLIGKGIKEKDILCLCPFNVSDCGNYRINNEIQAEINPPKTNELIFERKINGTHIVFREGSRVINKKNDYEALPLSSYEMIQNDENGLLRPDDVPHTEIFNGQRGIVRKITKSIMVVQFGEEMIVFDKLKANNLLLGWSQSTHSAQGQEAQYVISIVNPMHKKMLNRNLLYVADTRAKTMHIDIGNMSTFNDALLVDGNELRNTWLKELLEEKENKND